MVVRFLRIPVNSRPGHRIRLRRFDAPFEFASHLLQGVAQDHFKKTLFLGYSIDNRLVEGIKTTRSMLMPSSRTLIRRFSLATLLLLGSASSIHAQAPHAKYMGAASCASSNCHGSANPRQSTSVLQNEYTTWSKHDQHAQAWLHLTTADAKKMGRHLGIENPEKEPWCLRCHATYPASPDLQSKEFRIEDGVSCESCHGAAEHYLRSHTQTGSTHAQNLERGLKNIVPLSERAQLCLTCHHGSEDAAVTHRLIGAGHPRLAFELDTFSMLQPRHWKVDDDYIKRKTAYNSARAWLIGQTELARATVEALASEDRSRSGPFPELSLLECYSCHHSLSQGQWRKREYQGNPGELRLNTASLLVVEQASRALGAPESDALLRATQALHASFREHGRVKETSSVLQALDTAEAYFSNHPLDQTALKRLLETIAQTGATREHLQYESAEQIAMALSSVLEELPSTRAALEADMKRIYDALRSPADFIAEDFTEACARLVARIR